MAEDLDFTRDTFNATALHVNALKTDFIHRQVGTSGKQDTAEFKGQSLTDPPTLRPTFPSVKTDAVDADKDGLYVSGIMNGTPVRFLVQAGANITIIQTQLWEAMTHSSASTPSQLKHVLDTMKLANRCSSSFQGCDVMTIGLGDWKLVHTIWVEGILG